MAATNAVVIYDALAAVLTPSTCLRRVVICDNDSQVIAANGPCKLVLGEVAFLIPMATYNGILTPAALINYVLARI